MEEENENLNETPGEIPNDLPEDDPELEEMIKRMLSGVTEVVFNDGVTVDFNIHNNAIMPFINIQNSPDAANILAAILKDLHGTTLGIKLVGYIAEHHEYVPQDQQVLEDAMSLYEEFIKKYDKSIAEYEEDEEEAEDPWPNGPLIRPTQVFQD